MLWATKRVPYSIRAKSVWWGCLLFLQKNYYSRVGSTTPVLRILVSSSHLFPLLLYIFYLYLSLSTFSLSFFCGACLMPLSLSHINPRRQNRVHIIKTIPSCVWLNFGYIFLFYSRKKKDENKINVYLCFWTRQFFCCKVVVILRE